MRWMLLAAALLAGAGVARADTPTEAQANVIKHVGNAAVLAERCGRAEVDMVFVTGMMVYHDMPVTAFSPGGPFEAAMRQSFERARGEIGDMSADAACATAMFLFGPQGANVPGLMKADR